MSVATAESCTGGLVAHLVTEVPGSSAYFRRRVRDLRDEVKTELVAVPAAVLASPRRRLAPRSRCAMADGARARLGADLALAVTGIAGPDGGTEAKPVGLTYVAVADAAGDDVRRYQWDGDRAGNKRASAAAALAPGPRAPARAPTS